ncbi:MAG: NUDIX domain-containing protein [Phycisphaerales bacterium]|nr:NUDIX domain-containing protein [Phycisphaerales bacterium]
MNERPGDAPAGARLRTDLVEAFIFRRRGGGVEILQMRRREGAGHAASTWQPVFGHARPGETAFDAARREVAEETGLYGADCRGWWQLEQVRPFFVAGANAVFLAPRFVVEAGAEWEPALNHEHVAHRWVALSHAHDAFLWPGQREAIREFAHEVLDPGSASAALLRLA